MYYLHQIPKHKPSNVDFYLDDQPTHTGYDDAKWTLVASSDNLEALIKEMRVLVNTSPHLKCVGRVGYMGNGPSVFNDIRKGVREKFLKVKR